MNRGIIYAISAYVFWGVHPIYWKMLKHVPSFEILAHRIFWSFIFLSILISFRKEWKSLIDKLNKKNIFYIILPALLIGSNWAVFVWAVNADYILETSLGYFICPLVFIFLGVFFLKEKLSVFQWLAILIAGASIFVMTFVYGQFPYIGLFLAFSWGFYGLMRKKSPFDALEGMVVEQTMLSVPMLIYILFLEVNGTGSFSFNIGTSILLIGAGIISSLPQLIYIIASRMIKLSLIGILQYIYPLMVLVIGMFIYHEPISESRIIGFILIWIAVIIYIVDELKNKKRLQNG